MSYNVDRFDVRELRDFTLPFDALMEMTEGSQTLQGDTYTFDEFDVASMEVVGTRSDDRLVVTELHYNGEYSGTYWDTFAKLLKQSTGHLRALVVWEGGDTVEWLTVDDGVLTTENV